MNDRRASGAAAFWVAGGNPRGRCWGPVLLGVVLAACRTHPPSDAAPPAATPSATAQRAAFRGSGPAAVYAVTRTDPLEASVYSIRLRQVAESVATARVVALGEATHGDGTAFKFKSDLITLLHRDYGFEHLVFEGGMFSCGQMDRALANGGSGDEAAKLCLFDIWRCSEQVQPILAYLAAARSREHPLLVHGVDPQLSGTAPKRYLLESLERVLPTGGLTPEAKTAVRHLFALETPRTRDEYLADRGALERLVTEARSLEQDGGLWARVVEGLQFLNEDFYDYQQTQTVSVAMMNKRDRLMAENLLWLVAKEPRAKYVLWFHNVHVARRLDGIVDAALRPWRAAFVPLGEHLAKRFGADYYALGLSAAGGHSAKSPRGERTAVPPLVPDALEQRARGAPGPVFLDRRQLVASGDAASLALGNALGRGAWSEVFDGLVVFPEMVGSQTRADCQE